MRRNVGDVAGVIALLVAAGLGVFLIVLGAGGAAIETVAAALTGTGGTVGLILVGVVLIGIAVRFLISLDDRRLNSAIYAHEAEWGRIALTPYAVKEFVRGILVEEVGLKRFRVDLHHQEDGVSITVRTTLSPEQRTTEVGERIQQGLSRLIPDRTGVNVVDVSVLVHGIRRESPRRSNYG
jgi:uncharacterized alkaline shock family protein YloU